MTNPPDFLSDATVSVTDTTVSGSGTSAGAHVADVDRYLDDLETEQRSELERDAAAFNASAGVPVAAGGSGPVGLGGGGGGGGTGGDAALVGATGAGGVGTGMHHRHTPSPHEGDGHGGGMADVDLGMDPNTNRVWDHPDDLRNAGSFDKTGGYKLPLLRSRKFQCGVAVVLLAALCAVVVGVASKDKADKRNEVDDAGLGGGDTQGSPSPPSGSPPSGNPPHHVPHHPTWFSDEQGWIGTTWDQSVSFCTARSMTLCSYTEMCPDGEGEVPRQGRSQHGEQWSAVSDEPNQWIQIGMIDTGDEDLVCVTHESLYGEKPDWGVDGSNTEETKWVLCCPHSTSDAPPPSPPTPSQPSHTASHRRYHHPMWFNADNGWGSSSSSSLTASNDFCASEGLELCPYETMCPDGPGGIPKQGKASEGEQYAAVLFGHSGQNDDRHWIQIGDVDDDDDVCQVYDAVYGGSPTDASHLNQLEHDADWWTSKTNWILCCPENYVNDHIAAPDPTATPGPAPQPHAVHKYHHDVWFNAENGYEGTTWEESKEFCQDTMDMYLCDFEQICKNGENEVPRQGAAHDVQWCASSNKYNQWIKIGPTEDDADYDTICTTYRSQQGERPDWGIDGSNPDETEWVLCCPNAPPPAPANLGNDHSHHHHPLWFNEDNGWFGGTYQESKSFCEEVNMELCPVTKMCKNGSGECPMEGCSYDDGEQWAADSTPNRWFLISGDDYGAIDDTCTSYKSQYDTRPMWSRDGTNHQGTKWVLCCPEGTNEGTVEDMQAPDPSPTPVPPPPALPQNTYHHSVWFNRENGWDGGDWDDANQYCTDQNMFLCDFHTMCPDGANQDPSQGRASEGEQWSPVSDHSNMWIQIGLLAEAERADDVCVSYESMHNGNAFPFAGTERHVAKHWVLCCPNDPADSSGTDDDHSDHVTHKARTSYHHPVWFNEDNGWEGGSYHASQDFCIAEHMQLCPYETMCPDGVGGVPKEGRSQNGDQWSAVSDEQNKWIQIGQTDPVCEAWSTAIVPNFEGAWLGQGPWWGLDGSNTEGTEWLLCCPEENHHMSMPEPSPTPAPPPPPHTTHHYHHAMWFNRENGWDGGDWNDADQYCSDLDMYLCNLHKMCPNGAGEDPKQGRASEGEQWSPVADKTNMWVQIGLLAEPERADDVCVSYESMHGGSSFPFQGTEAHVKKHWVLCCPDDPAADDDHSTHVTVQHEQPIYHHPVWFNADNGWEGGSYHASQDFCATEYMELCDFDSMCPDGQGGDPKEGRRQDGEQWSAVSDEPNMWISIGQTDPVCEPWSTDIIPGYAGAWLDNHGPWWGLDGSNTDVTEWVLCCPENNQHMTAPNPSPTPAPPPPPHATHAYHHPMWFNRENGWDSNTYANAATFCMDLDMVICPFDKLCPFGAGDHPKQGRVSDDEQWAPVADINVKWVQVGIIDGGNENDDDVCVSYNTIYGHTPNVVDMDASDWILCCPPVAN